MSDPTGRSPQPQPRPGSGNAQRWWWALRIVAMVLSAGVGVCYVILWLLFLGSAVGSTFDPHGYTLIFSVLFMVPVGVVFCLVFPFCWPSGRRLRVALFTLLGFLLSVVLAFALLAWVD